MLQRCAITGRTRFVRKSLEHIRPARFWADAELRNAAHSIAQHAACILVDGALHHPLVVIDEQARRKERTFHALLHLLEPMCVGERVGSATPNRALIEHRWARATK